MNDLLKAFQLVATNGLVSTKHILLIVFVTVFMSLYEFVIYRLVAHKNLYNNSFNISLLMIPIFISTIIMCLQSNSVITLGTIGALAIIRYRTAIKDPIDMVYLLWSVHTGICCGCQLFSVSIITSIVVTIILVVVKLVLNKNDSYCIVINCKTEDEKNIVEFIKKLTKKVSIRSKNYTANGLNIVIEFVSKDINTIAKQIENNSMITNYSIVQYDMEDII